MVPVQSLGQLTQHRMFGVGGDALDDELIAGDAERQRGAVAQQARRSIDNRRCGRVERGVIARIHRVFVQRDGQFDQKIREVA
jgi:hypothetical protein